MAIVNGLILDLTKQISAALCYETQYAFDFLRELEVMRSRLQLIQVFLEEDEYQKKEILLNTLDALRELLYETDDILTDCLIREKYRKTGLCSKFSLPGLSFRLQTHKKLKDINTRLVKVEEILKTYLNATRNISYEGDIDRFSRLEYDLSEETVVGVQRDVEKIKEWIFSPSYRNLQMMGIVGMGGLGKTTIARLIFNDRDIRCHFDRSIWVSVSQNFTVDAILRSILEQLGETSRGKYILDIIFHLLKEQTCLIILDDIWDTGVEWWMSFFSQLQRSASKGTCIIITTRNQDVAYTIGIGAERIHQPKLLDDEESWSLFSKFAFGKKNNEGYGEFEFLGRKILHQCGGLPLAIKTIGALLGSTDSLTEWHAIFKRFCEPNITKENSIAMNSLRLSYKELPATLKRCLLCLSIYPQDFEITAWNLICWWIGEGFIRDSLSKTAMEMGSECLSELVNRCLVEVVQKRGYDGRVYSAKMHNMVRDLTILMAEEERICSFNNQGQQEFMPNSRWLGFTSEMGPKSLQRCPKLRALLLISNQAFSDRNLGSLSSLRVLDLSNSKLDDTLALQNLLTWISSLKRLAYLNLSGAQGLQELPSSIRKLQNLQLLVLTGCTNLSKLSPSITSLKHLLLLDVSSCVSLPYLPHGLLNLSQLQELSGVRLARPRNSTSCRLLELGELRQLRVLRMILNNHSEITADEFNVLSNLQKLKILGIDAENCEHMKDILDRLCPPPMLKELYIRRYRHETLPKWVNPDRLHNLEYLCIEDGGLVDISSSAETDGDTYWSLEGLCLRSLPYLQMEWNDLLRKMRLLRYAEVSHCPQLYNFPWSVQNDPRTWRRFSD
ncbi:hypothetical protein JCGZ_01850 [Jatropha curcas]|uniref:Uncharacterized protein n=1 Tax=Jatropha curcas TaxID=180498 RepID=A0A067L0V4_JATCU|nr:disease resistance RPP13-like protein 4 [Jatropha curcas]XP_020533406.1 disease resistance RPP13-like protein 4 [Jatropha curcas]XP_020533407.1 disease resistance RPP13-like protein 4 [Jatropha curcas]KDP42062.1 hypothetical protein JCGZ_01850 [Jatropha curcas]